ncbi:condensation domain-containing protein [Actinokineospora sp. 24-640]
MVDTILVDFTGAGSGVGPLTWGQRTVWRVVALTGTPPTLAGIVPLAPGTTLEHAVAVLRHVMGRHQSLRTRLLFDDPAGEPRQQVHDSGEIGLAVIDAAGEDPAEVAERVKREYQGTSFDPAGEWPVRMAVVVADGAPTHSVAVYSHLAIDAHGLDALVADLSNMDATGPPAAMQPLELAAKESTPAADRQTEAVLRYWERVLRTASPRCVDGESDDKREPRWGSLRFTSPASLLATRVIATRVGIDTSPVLLAGYAVALARTIGPNPVVLQMAVNNRFRQSLVNSVCTLAQTCPLMVDVADLPFDEAVRRAKRATMITYKYAYYDPNRRAAMVKAVKADLPDGVELDSYFNDRRPPGRTEVFTDTAGPEEITAARARARHEWVSWTDVDSPLLYLNVDDDADALRFTLTVDTHRAAPKALVGLATEIEAVLVEAALDPAARTGVLA